jgi:formamidopyrimidine-DNA glycosylase
MTGSLLLSPNQDDPDRFIRAIIHLDEGGNLYFRDPRKFGVMWLARDTDDLEKKLGPEPLEEGFTLEVLKERLRNRKAPIKALLLDQNLLAGVGNMYADEALFSAGIHPLRSGDSLSTKEVARLYHAIREILWAAIGNKGASVENYFRPGGELGTAHFQFRVAHKLGGDTCPVCQAPIERTVVRNRGTYFCAKCQPRKS